MWKIDHAERRGDGTVSVCRLAFIDKDDKGKNRKKTYQLQTAISIPPPGPGHGPAIAAMRQLCKGLRKPVESPDLSEIVAELNAEDE